MKIVLTILAVLQLIGGLIGCLFALGSNPLISLLFLGGGIVGAVPYVALISVLEDIAVLKEEQRELKGRLRHFIPVEGVPPADEQTKSAGSQPLSHVLFTNASSTINALFILLFNFNNASSRFCNNIK